MSTDTQSGSGIQGAAGGTISTSPDISPLGATLVAKIRIRSPSRAIGCSDTIEDFDYTVDRIQLFGAQSLGEVAISHNGAGLMLDWHGQSITLAGVSDPGQYAGWLLIM